MTTIRPMHLDDLQAIEAIQQVAYAAELVEPIDVLAQRRALAPEFCFIAREDDLPGDEHARSSRTQSSQLTCLGYLLAHPWPADDSPGLSRTILELPPSCDAIHLHDMAVAPSAAGRGIGRALLQQLIEASIRAHFTQITLVAVQDAAGFWQKMQFQPQHPAAGYDDDAVFMRRILR